MHVQGTQSMNALAFGEKHWFLHPPSQAYYKKRGGAGGGEKGEGGLQCVQNSGDLLFVPPMWSHATRNAKQSIGVTFELLPEENRSRETAD